MKNLLPLPEQIKNLPPDGGSKFNRLVFQNSPYLLQHADNPVDWYPWSDEALKQAKADNKPIFLSVGYSTCHWCHVMARESFEDPTVAAILNQYFIPVKVDREEHPEIDEIYMKATQLLTGGGGWPNSVFLTPESKPFFAGTYFPPDDRYGRPGFKIILNKLADLWQNRQGEIKETAEQIWAEIKNTSFDSKPRKGALPDLELVNKAIKALSSSFDPEWGGFGGAPKFPPHTGLRLLLEKVRKNKDKRVLEMITITLDEMAGGGIRDHIGGGFHRYSTDNRWFAPHFEKMLYDNAQLIRSYVEGYILTGKENHREVAIEICDWALREMRDKRGGFYSALDADSDGMEGGFYTWKREEIMTVLGKEEGTFFSRIYGILPEGNWNNPGHPHDDANIVFLPRPLSEAYGTDGIEPEELRRRLAVSKEKLFRKRQSRAKPFLDDKIMTDWNGLMIGSMAYAGKVLNVPRYLEAAGGAARFLLSKLYRGGRLFHVYRSGETGIPAYLDDYANLSDGLIELYQATGKKEWLDSAIKMADEIPARFWDKRGGGFFSVALNKEEKGSSIILFRSKDPYDRAFPSGNGVAGRVLLHLYEFTGNEFYLRQAESLLRAFRDRMEESPRGTESLILAALIYLTGQS